MKEIIILRLIELAIALLQGFFTLMAIAGKTPEEQEALYASEKAKFEANKPELLPDV